MISHEEREELIQRLKQYPIDVSAGSSHHCEIGRADIYQIIPHRPPFALIDEICLIDLERSLIEANCYINPADPIFEGHFPGEPVYPGVMQIEIMAQAGLCLAYFLKNNSLTVQPGLQPVMGLFTRVHNAGFIKPLYPEAKISVRVELISDDDWIGLMAAQILIDNDICSHSILEVYYP